jgi:peptidoglycan hydrolase FlgJ
MAVAQLETQDGKKNVGTHNLFNIKTSDPAKGTRAKDKAEGSNDYYRNFNSRQEAIDHFVGLLERKHPHAYKAMLEGDAEAFAAGMVKTGYATDPKYAEKLMSVLRSRKE